MFSPSVRVAFSYAGYPGVVGSPKYVTVSNSKDIQYFNALTRIQGEELHRAPLNGSWVSCRTKWVWLISVLDCHDTIISWVRVNQYRNGTALLCAFDLD